MSNPTIINWCAGDACDPCGALLARLHPISATVGPQSITETWGPAGCDVDLTGKTITGGLIECSYISAPGIQPPYDYLYGSTWSGPMQFGTEPPGSITSRIDPGGYDVTITTPGPSGSAHNTNIVITPAFAAGVEVGALGAFTLNASTTGYFDITPGDYIWSSSFGDAMFIGGFAAWIEYH
jgi:hypothetical protein